MTIGPVQVLVLGFEEPRFDGSALAELARLGEAGVIRLVDLLVVSRSEDGTLETAEVSVEGYGDLAAGLFARAEGDEGDEGEAADVIAEALDTWSLADVVPETGVAVVVLLEHLWAAPLGAAVRSAGGTLLEEAWLSAEDRALLASLES